jgi:hypothetical protein
MCKITPNHLFLVYHDEHEGEQIQLHANLPSEEAVHEHILKPLQETVTWSHGDTPTLMTSLHRVYVYRSEKHYQTLRLPDGRFPNQLPAEYVLHPNLETMKYFHKKVLSPPILFPSLTKPQQLILSLLILLKNHQQCLTQIIFFDGSIDSKQLNGS